MNDPAQEARRWPLGLIGLLGIILVVESAIGHYEFDLMSGFQWDWRLAWENTPKVAEDAEVLCFGDSQLKFGIVPQLLERQLGASVFNLALVGGRCSSSYFLLRRVLESGHRPRAVVVDFFPFFMKQGHQPSLSMLPEILTLRDGLDLSVRSRDGNLLGHLVTARLLPSFRNRQGLRDQLANLVSGSQGDPLYTLSHLIRNYRVNRGSMLMPSVAGRSYDADEWRRTYFSDTNFRPVNLIYLDRFLSIAEDYHIPVYWVLPPNDPSLRAECRKSGYDVALTQFVRHVQKKHPAVVVLDARACGFDADLFNDPHHLGSKGAYALTRSLGDALAENWPPSSQRWITLPRYQPRPIDWPLENIDASKAVVLRQAQSIRR
jgi:hypothetical protein